MRALGEERVDRLLGPNQVAAGQGLGVLVARDRAGAGYKYSKALTGSDLVWTEETVDALFAQGPHVFTPGSKMPLQQMPKAEDRAELIAYLKRVTEPAK